ncbi:MAG: acyl carrier protein [Clostridiales bacterium]|nr:acyl carrier protein [Clostridiales bacterium]
MNKKLITEKLMAILKENTVMIIDDENIKEDTDFIEELGFDSLSIIRFITDVEREFNIEFDFEELVSEVIGKYGTLLEVIEKKLNKEQD